MDGLLDVPWIDGFQGFDQPLLQVAARQRALCKV